MLTTRLRLLAAAAGVAVVAMLAPHGSSSAGQHARSASGPRAHTNQLPASGTGTLFAGRVLAYAFHGFTAPELQRITAAVPGTVPVDVGAVAVASGKAAYPVVPVEAMTVAPDAYAAAVGEPSLAKALREGAVLASGEARLRHLAVGQELRLADGRHITVSAVVDDHVVGGLEMALPRSFVTVRRGTAASYILLPSGPAAASKVTQAMRGREVRVRSHTANGFFSADDFILTQLQVKERFGEFAMRELPGGDFEMDPSFEDTRLAWVPHVEQLGPVKCNRGVIGPLRAAMHAITVSGLGSTIDTADFEYEGGCWNPKVIPLSGGDMSRHAWGIAVDINVARNQLGVRTHQDKRLIAVMRKYGFAWGGDFLRPDGMHFEYVGPQIAAAGLR